MKHLEIYLESLTLKELCEQNNDFTYETALEFGISKRQIIEGMLKKQIAHLGKYN